MEEKEKSEFMLATEAFAKEIANLTNKDGVKRGIVILASEDLGGETAQTIAVAGNGMEAIKAIAEFATRNETKDLCREGIKMGAIKSTLEAIRGYSRINLTIKI